MAKHSKGIKVHPGEVLRGYLEQSNISQAGFARHIGITSSRLSEVVNGRRGITVDTALRFSKALGTTPQFWTSLQAEYDISRAVKPGKRISRLKGTVIRES